MRFTFRLYRIGLTGLLAAAVFLLASRSDIYAQNGAGCGRNSFSGGPSCGALPLANSPPRKSPANKSPLPPTCGPDDKVHTPGDGLDQLADFMEKQIKAAIAKLNPNTDSSRIDKLNKWLGYWQNIKAASCVPNLVMTNITGYLSGNLQCTNLCSSLKGWFEQMYPGPNGGAVGEQLNESCFADCAER